MKNEEYEISKYPKCYIHMLQVKNEEIKYISFSKERESGR